MNKSLNKRRIMALILYLFVNINKVNGKAGFGPGEQDWGYVQVRPGAHMFWWLYYVNPPVKPAVFDVFSRPLLIWLQGHPGVSATGFGNFGEVGPFDLNLQERDHTWINDFNVLFIDNLGTGFSYLENFSNSTSGKETAQELVELMRGFFEAVPEFKNIPTYILGEFYSGKVAVETAFLWYKIQERGDIESNLKGVATGDSLISPADTVISYAPFLLNAGLVDPLGFKKIKIVADKTINEMNVGNWNNALNLWDYTLKMASNYTGKINFKRLLKQKAVINTLLYYISHEKLLSDLDVHKKLTIIMNGIKESLNLNVTWSYTPLAAIDFPKDFTKPINKIVERLLDETNLRVVVWSGKFNSIAVTPGTLVWVEKLKWKYSEAWRNSKTNPLVIDNIIEGCYKEFNNFKIFLIKHNSHTVYKLL
ncbi:retinoid-inducible serine carboxypeptidase [Microplitis demolitor]|uniref:retinoid-inducible serine carboxypeptidase n=1 Tax=Microplitis demolitor TaxID=69319 RepID=UPI0004CDD89A|nr:retinoid-inducible serine carboxypeptidase [Microplitis demolitor]